MGSLFSTPKAPKAPDPVKTTETQSQYNTQAAAGTQAMNAMNQSNPYGSLTYTQTGTGPGGVPIYSASQQLSPEQQSLLNTLQGTKQTAGSAASDLLSSANYGGDPNITGSANSLTNQQMGNYLNSIQPFMTTQVNNLDNQMRNQGIMPGTPAYDNQMRALQQTQGQTVSGAAANYENQAFNQAMQEYQLPAQMATSLATFGANTSLPSTLVNTPQTTVAPANYSQNVYQSYQGDLQNYQNQLNQQNSMLSGLFGIGAAGIKAYPWGN